MKTLTKIKLINWHGFYNETIEIKNSALITGENGCGKSTLMDAISFVLTGGEERFNVAANETTGRSLETYMRGKTGVEGRIYLRNEANIVSHIALEYFDEATKKYFVIGVVLEIRENRNKIERSFYHIQNSKLDENWYVDNTEYGVSIKNYQAMKKQLGELLFELPDSRQAIRKALYNILNLETVNDKYYELLPKAMAFKAIPDVNNFVYQFLMPQKDIDIEGIRTSIRTYNEMLAHIKTEKEKQVKLEDIIKLGEAYTNMALEIECLGIYRLIVKKANLGNLISAKEKENIVKNEAIYEEKKAKAQLDAYYEKTIQDIAAIQQSEAYLKLAEIRNELKTAEKEIEETQNKVDLFNKKILAEEAIGEKLHISANFSRFIKSQDYPSFKLALEEYRLKYVEKVNEINEKISSSKTSLASLKSDENDLLIREEKLKKGLPAYPVYVDSLIKLLKDKISLKFGNTPVISPLCELMEIKNEKEEYRSAIEGYLGIHKFDLFVSEEYYDYSIETYNKFKHDFNLFDVAIVDIKKIGNQKSNENSLATFVSVTDERAQRYVNYLLGNVEVSDNLLDFSEKDSVVSKEAFIHSNKVTKQANFAFIKEPFIGRNSIAIQLKNVSSQLKELRKNIDKVEVNLTKLESLRRYAQTTDYSLILNLGNAWFDYENSQRQHRILKERYDKLEVNQSLTQDLDPLLKTKEELTKNRDESDSKIIALLSEVKTNNDKIDELKVAIEECDVELTAKYLVEGAKDRANRYIETNKLGINEIEKKLKDDEKQVGQTQVKVVSAMREYIDLFRFDAIASVDSIEAFNKEYNLVVKRELEQYQVKLEAIKQNASLIFQNSYIADIRKHILDEEANINKLNKVLANKQFGSDGEIYKFVISRSKDNNFGQYYDIFKSKQDFNVGDLFTEQLSDKNLILMRELFDRLTAEVKDVNQEKLVKQYTDYRQFMNYDIKITNNRGEETYFSKINKEKSGGETQTPFYVIIAASFDQIVEGNKGRNRNPGCLVMFDEAFNNMDESRIESMMEYFTNLSIQPIIAVPTQRATTIMKYVDTSVVLVKKHDRIFHRIWRKK